MLGIIDRSVSMLVPDLPSPFGGSGFEGAPMEQYSWVIYLCRESNTTIEWFCSWLGPLLFRLVVTARTRIQ